MSALTPYFTKSLHNGLQRMYDDNKGDVVFVCGSLNKNVHSFLLGARSTVFDKMLRSLFQEGHSKQIELKEQNPHLTARMLQHLYTFDYPGHKMSIGDDEESSYVSELHTHAQMYALGDEYDIHDLKEEALWKFERAIEAKEGISDELTDVIEVIPTVYETTPDNDRGLRDAVVAFGAKNLKQMEDLPELKIAAIRVPVYLIEVLPAFLIQCEEDRFQYGKACGRCENADEWVFASVICMNCNSQAKLYPDTIVPAS